MRYFVWALSLLLITTPYAHGLSLDEAFQRALTHHESLDIQRSAVRAADAKIDQAASGIYPQVILQGSEYFQDNSAADSSSGASSTFTASHKPEYKFTLSQSLFRGFRDHDTLEYLRESHKKQNMILEQTKRRVLVSAAEDYFAVLLAQKTLLILDEFDRLLSSQVSELNRRIRVGKSRQNELLSTEASLLSLRADREIALGELSAARLRLSHTLGLSLGDDDVDDVTLANEDLPNLDFVTKSVRFRPEIEALNLDISSQKIQKKLYSNSSLPSIDLSGHYYLERISYLDPIKWDVALTASLPILDGGLREGSLKESDALIAQAETQKTLITREITTHLLTTLESVRSSSSQTRTLKEAYEKGKRSYDVSLNDYRLGLMNHLEVLQTLNALLDIKRSLILSEINYAKARTLLSLEIAHPL
jgi:adhesin transport system outer membrane protein